MSAAADVVYDAGALLAAEAGSREFMAMHATFVRQHREIVVPSPVLAQVWRGGARQAPLAGVLRTCVVEATTADTAKSAGALLGRSRTSDAVDAIVAVTAAGRDAVIVTSDPRDLTMLWELTGTQVKPAIVPV